MNEATNRFACRSYSSRGLANCWQQPVAKHRNPIAHRHRLRLIVGDVEWLAFEAGRLAAEMLIDQLGSGVSAPRQVLIPAELVVRDSTGPAPRHAALVETL